MDIATRFWLKVERRSMDECWPWDGAKKGEYGAFNVEGNRVLAHRVAWELFTERKATGQWVLHHCDNPACCNPRHLYLGTPADNARDRVTRGRGRSDTTQAVKKRKPGWNRKTRDDDGRSNRPSRHLTATQIQEIRDRYASGASLRSISRDYRTTHPTIKRIVNRLPPYDDDSMSPPIKPMAERTEMLERLKPALDKYRIEV